MSPREFGICIVGWELKDNPKGLKNATMNGSNLSSKEWQRTEKILNVLGKSNQNPSNQLPVQN